VHASLQPAAHITKLAAQYAFIMHMHSHRTVLLPAVQSPKHHLCMCSSVTAMETVHKTQLENQQTILVHFEALDKELVLVPVKVKTGTHRGAYMLFVLVSICSLC
jgi:hypothetical protein